MVQPRLFNRELEDGGASATATLEAPGASGGTTAAEGPARQPERTTRTTPAARPAPVPRRPKGRLLVGLVLLAGVVVIAVLVWNSFLRFEAYGTVMGRVVEVPPPWTGVVEALYVRDGDEVRQGDVLAVLQNPEIDVAIDSLIDELRVAQAELDAEVARLALESQNTDDRRQLAQAEYYKMLGELLAEESKLSGLSSTLSRHQMLVGGGAVSDHEYDAVKFAEAGQRAKIERLKQAVEELRRRAESVQGGTHQESRLKPKVARIEQIQGDIQRLREKLRRGAVRAPDGGRVLQVRNYVGEYVEPEKPLIELLRDGSVQVVVFVEQAHANRFKAGQTIEVQVEPLARRIRCRVDRVADRLEEPPNELATHYREGEKVLPVVMTPLGGAASALRLGSEVRIPSPWFSLARFFP